MEDELRSIDLVTSLSLLEDFCWIEYQLNFCSFNSKLSSIQPLLQRLDHNSLATLQ